MTTQNHQLSRRSLLKGLAAIPVFAVVGYQSDAQAEMVSADDPTAKALRYTENSAEAGKSCSNCALYQGGTAAAGPCPIFPGKKVAATGWCTSYAPKP